MARHPHRTSARARMAAAATLVALAATAAPATMTASPDPGVGSGYRALTASAGTDPGPDRADDHDGDGIVAAPAVAVAAVRTTIELDASPEMAIVTGIAPDTELAVRSRNHGEWSEWIHVESDDDERPDDGLTATSGVGPIWLGPGADRLEIERLHGAPVPFDVELLHAVDPPATAADGPQGVAASSATPFIRPRSSWATSAMTWPESCGEEPARGSAKAIVVHHTAGTNGYSAADVPAVIRGIWYYHAQSRGWCDIAYNFLVDRFGGVWEGRQGGITEPIVGGHTFGFNTDTIGIAQLGDFDGAAPPYAMTRATWRLVGWKAGLHDIDPLGRTTVTNRATVPAKNGTPAGGSIDIPTVVGHRDLGSTSCPGHNTYAHRHTIRTEGYDGAYAYAMYEALVRRMPMDRSYLDAAAALEQHGAHAAANQIAYSDDYAGVAIDDLYRLILGRGADAAGRANWLRYVNAGNRLETVATRFFASEEYWVSQLRTNAVYVESLYEKILGRPGDPGGIAHWTLQLEQEHMTRRQVAASFYASGESRLQRVERLYQEILGRTADESGRETWARKLRTVDDLKLATFLVSSAEFRVRFV